MTLFVVVAFGGVDDDNDDDGVVLLPLSLTRSQIHAFGCHFFHMKYGSLKATA